MEWKTTIEQYLKDHNIQLIFNEEDRKRIPETGAFLAISNRLIEGVDEVIQLYLVGEKVTNFHILSGLSAPPGLEGRFLEINMRSVNLNRPLEPFIRLMSKLAELKEEDRSIGMVVDFTGNRFREIRRTPYLNRLFKVVQQRAMPIIPIRIYTEDPNPLLKGKRGIQLVQLLKQKPLKVHVRLGTPISVEDQQVFEERDRFRRFIQSKIFALGSSLEVRRFYTLPRLIRPEQEQPLAGPADPMLIEQDIQKLTFKNLVASQGEFDVFVARADEIPHVLNEIGRLREQTFRQVGEGTGKPVDLDEYDLYYHQLILWDREAKRIVGGYRMGKGDEIVERYGPGGLYISSLFRIEGGFHPIMKKAVELGRSYIVHDYQRKRLPLFLLWKGILFFLLQNPQYRYLYGPVSVSKYYSNVSKSLIVEFIKRHYFDEELAQYLRPRKPFKAKLEKVDLNVLTESLGDEMKMLDNIIEDIEPKHVRLPVLMRQYIKLNARFISFNVDPNFSDVLDGFIILDLENVPYQMIEALKKEF